MAFGTVEDAREEETQVLFQDVMLHLGRKFPPVKKKEKEREREGEQEQGDE